MNRKKLSPTLASAFSKLSIRSISFRACVRSTPKFVATLTMKFKYALISSSDLYAAEACKNNEG
jgi:hypothetical protein